MQLPSSFSGSFWDEADWNRQIVRANHCNLLRPQAFPVETKQPSTITLSKMTLAASNWSFRAACLDSSSPASISRRTRADCSLARRATASLACEICSPAKSSTFSGSMKSPPVGQKLKCAKAKTASLHRGRTECTRWMQRGNRGIQTPTNCEGWVFASQAAGLEVVSATLKNVSP